MIRILDQDRGLVTESGLRFLEADPVPAPIAGRLGRIPSEVQLAHGSNVCTMYAWRKFSRVQPNAWHMCCGRTTARGRQLTMCVLCGTEQNFGVGASPASSAGGAVRARYQGAPVRF